MFLWRSARASGPRPATTIMKFAVAPTTARSTGVAEGGSGLATAGGSSQPGRHRAQTADPVNRPVE